MIGKGDGKGNNGGATGNGRTLSEKELVLKQKLCVELMEVVNVISPGKNKLSH